MSWVLALAEQPMWHARYMHMCVNRPWLICVASHPWHAVANYTNEEATLRLLSDLVLELSFHFLVVEFSYKTIFARFFEKKTWGRESSNWLNLQRTRTAKASIADGAVSRVMSDVCFIGNVSEIWGFSHVRMLECSSNASNWSIRVCNKCIHCIFVMSVMFELISIYPLHASCIKQCDKGFLM